MTKQILVTGGAGFIGSHLIRRLLADGHRVLCVDNLFSGHTRNISPFANNPRFEFIHHDITNPLELSPSTTIDEIYNLACPASPRHYQLSPIRTTKTAVLGALNMLDLADRFNSKILQASTSEIYGDPTEHPQTESYWGNVNPFGPRSCYDEGKRCAESLFFDYHRQLDVEVKVARFFNCYGPNLDDADGRVIGTFIAQALRGQDITIFGTGEQTRSFCFVSDLIEAIVRLMATGKDVTGPINLGNPEEVSILEIAERIVRLSGSKSQIVFRDLPENDPRRRRPDISVANALLTWQPQVSLDEGLLETISWFRGALPNHIATPIEASH